VNLTVTNAQGNDDKRISYAGEISIDPAVKIAGFKAAGLSVDVCPYCCLYYILIIQEFSHIGLYLIYGISFIS